VAKIKAFKGFRPVVDKVHQVASRPYDVLNTKEARAEAEGNPYSFLHVVKPEIDFPSNQNPYAPEIYEKGKENFESLVGNGVFSQDEKNSLYIYRLTMNGKSQAGIVAAAAIDDYFNDVIKKHELTRPDKEEDRKKHVRVSMMNAEPVFFAYPALESLDGIVNEIIESDPEYDFTADDGVRHELWVVQDNKVDIIIKEFEKLPATYVADGHHRTAAGALVGQDLRNENPNYTGDESFNYFLAVHFPDNQLNIIDYNRVVKDLSGLSKEDFLEKLSTGFVVEKIGRHQYKPSKLHEFGMYLEGVWYKLTAKDGTYNDADPIGVLDVTILSKQILEPVLNIIDLRTDKRIDFVGGIRGLGELEKRVDSGEMKVAFALYPVSMQQLINIADSGQIMPPKTTWFEPKLRSGLVVHSLK
jgi:uncharacterized protein (DUF1015 family)